MGTVAFCPLNPGPVTSSGHLRSISEAWVLSTPYSTKKSRLMPELAPVMEALGLGRGFGSSTPAPSSPFSQKHTSASGSLRDGDFLSQTLRPVSSWALRTPRPHAEVTGRGSAALKTQDLCPLDGGYGPCWSSQPHFVPLEPSRILFWWCLSAWQTTSAARGMLRTHLCGAGLKPAQNPLPRAGQVQVRVSGTGWGG